MRRGIGGRRMRRAATTVVVALLAAGAAACGGESAGTADAAPQNTPPRGGNVSDPAASAADAPAAGAPRVLVAGTSLTAGLGLDPSDAYPALLQRKADSAGYAARVVNAGLSGETSAGLARRIDWLLEEPAAVVVIETGANDGLRGLDVDSLGANLRGIVGTVRARQPDARILLVQMEAPPNFGARYTQTFRETFARVAADSAVTLVPFLLDGVAGVGALNQDDGIHPNEDGAEIVAATVWRALEPVLASLDRPLATR